MSTPSTAYRVLGSIQLFVAVFAAAFALVSPTASGLWAADLGIVIILAPLGVATWRLGPRSRLGWALGASLAVTEALAILGLLFLDTAEGQLTVALGLVLFGFFAGYFRPTPWLYGHVLLLACGFGLVARINPHLSRTVVTRGSDRRRRSASGSARGCPPRTSTTPSTGPTSSSSVTSATRDDPLGAHRGFAGAPRTWAGPSLTL